MWKITVCCNIIILSLLWLLSLVAITPAHNLLILYGDAEPALPVLTDLAIRLRSMTVAIPLAWAFFTFLGIRRMQRQTGDKKLEWILLHTSISLCIGLGMFLFFLLAGILPILKIGSVIG